MASSWTSRITDLGGGSPPAKYANTSLTDLHLSYPIAASHVLHWRHQRQPAIASHPQCHPGRLPLPQMPALPWPRSLRRGARPGGTGRGGRDGRSRPQSASFRHRQLFEPSHLVNAVVRRTRSASSPPPVDPGGGGRPRPAPPPPPSRSPLGDELRVIVRADLGGRKDANLLHIGTAKDRSHGLHGVAAIERGALHQSPVHLSGLDGLPGLL